MEDGGVGAPSPGPFHPSFPPSTRRRKTRRLKFSHMPFAGQMRPPSSCPHALECYFHRLKPAFLFPRGRAFPFGDGPCPVTVPPPPPTTGACPRPTAFLIEGSEGRERLHVILPDCLQGDELVLEMFLQERSWGRPWGRGVRTGGTGLHLGEGWRGLMRLLHGASHRTVPCPGLKGAGFAHGLAGWHLLHFNR